MWLAARAGKSLLRKKFLPDQKLRDDFNFVLPAALTLLALIVGFSFSMAITHYDQRKNYEEGEANAIGTAYVRAKLLPAADAAKVQAILKGYLDQRILWYEVREDAEVRKLDARVAQLQDQMWEAILPEVTAHPTQIAALVTSGMNDVLNSQGYTQSAWWYRIPSAAWALMFAIALVCNLLIGYIAKGGPMGPKMFYIFPLLMAISFMLIADIDAPRYGLIRVQPLNLTSLAQSLGTR
jgi:hypothetical protein